MGVKIAYNQVLRYENQLPTNLPKLAKVTSICETRQNDKLPKTADVVEFMKRPIRYTFNIYPKSTSSHALPMYNYTFDRKEDAQQAYKLCMDAWIDEQLEPYRKLLNEGKMLTLEQLEKCDSIQNLYKED